MSTTTKADLSDAVHGQLGGFSKKESAELVDGLFDVLREALSTGDRIKLSGFGNFTVRFKKPRVGRNPLTGEEMEISARHVVTFRASPVLKDRINAAQR
jgi:integration host factor subunit alpha